MSDNKTKESLFTTYNVYRMSLTNIRTSALSALTAAVLCSLMLLASFLVLEPTVGQAQINDTFEVTQTITGEISFEQTANDVDLQPSLSGISGGTSHGSTTVRVRTNNATGYNMTIAFSSTTAMTRDGGSGYINNYAPATPGVPDYSFSNEVFAQFAYSVVASTTSDVDQTFLDNGSNACNEAAGSNGNNTCWYNPSTTAETIINRTTATAASGATTTLKFRVHIPNEPVPAIQTGVYTATATLTATANP